MSSRFRKLSHTLRHCQFHIVWVPKYRYRVLQGAVKEVAVNGIMAICVCAGCEVVELNVQPDQVHLVVKIPRSGKLVTLGSRSYKQRLLSVKKVPLKKV